MHHQAQLAKLLSDMLAFSAAAHNGQFDKGGMPYILHPLKVMYKLKTDDIELMCIALGHDLVEDCGVTYQDLIKLGCTLRIIDGIRALTKVPGETYEEYKAKVKANFDAVLVKMQDLRHNMDLRRLKGITAKDMQRAARYMEFYKELEEVLNESQQSKAQQAS
jgi:(p)ppGpp synthase/HD superfamily hydrolase